MGTLTEVDTIMVAGRLGSAQSWLAASRQQPPPWRWLWQQVRSRTIENTARHCVQWSCSTLPQVSTAWSSRSSARTCVAGLSVAARRYQRQHRPAAAAGKDDGGSPGSAIQPKRSRSSSPEPGFAPGDQNRSWTLLPRQMFD